MQQSRVRFQYYEIFFSGRHAFPMPTRRMIMMSRIAYHRVCYPAMDVEVLDDASDKTDLATMFYPGLRPSLHLAMLAKSPCDRSRDQNFAANESGAKHGTRPQAGKSSLRAIPASPKAMVPEFAAPLPLSKYSAGKAHPS